MSLKQKLKQHIVDAVATEAAADPKIKKLLQLNPNFKHAYIMNAWSGFIDGDPEHHVFHMAIGGDWWDDRIDDEAPNDSAFRKFLDTEFVAGCQFGGQVQTPYSAAERDEVVRFRSEQPEAFKEYFDTLYELAKETLSPIKDMVPMDNWIKIPISG